MTERKPHLLHVTLNWCGNEGISYEIECPYDDLGNKRPCTAWNECDHRHPDKPESAHPTVVAYHDGEPEFAAGTDEKVVVEWLTYLKASDEFVNSHPNGPWEPSDDCWVRQFVQEGGYEDGWQFIRGFEKEVMGPVPVEYENAGGSFDETSLVLKPWKESDGE
jgi:hypothetical protein